MKQVKICTPRKKSVEYWPLSINDLLTCFRNGIGIEEERKLSLQRT